MWPRRKTLVSILLFVVCGTCCNAWQWSDYVSKSWFTSSDTLSLQQVSDMRVRDIKRKLARTHGYGADELSKMLDKKELINALAYEEYKVHQDKMAHLERAIIKRGIMMAIVAVLVVLCWPLLTHLYDVLYVNIVVYTDRKRHETTKCWEFQSIKGGLGVLIMGILDLLGIWLTVTVLLSWIMSTRSKYFFPIPSLTIKPAMLMGGEVASGPLSRYGFNTGPMLITWGLRFLHGRVESWVGRCLSKCRQDMKKAKRKRKKSSVSQQQRAARQEQKAKQQQQEQTITKQQGETPTSAPQKQKDKTTDQVPLQKPLVPDTQEPNDSNLGDKTPISSQTPPTQQQQEEPSPLEKRTAAAAAAEARWKSAIQEDTHTAFDDLD